MGFYVGSKWKKGQTLRGTLISAGLSKMKDGTEFARVILAEKDGEKSMLECSEQILSSLEGVVRGDALEISAIMRPGKKKNGEAFERTIFVVEKLDAL